MKPQAHRYTVEQLRAIKSPVRSDILTTLLAHEVGSVREISDWTGRELTSLYPHVRGLLAAGLIHVVEVRSGRKRKEQVYAPVASHFDRSLPSRDPAYRGAYADSIATSMKNVERKVRAAAARNDANGLHVGTLNAFLDEDDLAQLTMALDDVLRRFRALNKPESGRRISLVFAMAPSE